MLQKRQLELDWQKQWAPTVKRNLPKIKEYWLKYRNLKRILDTIGKPHTAIDVGCGISSVLHFVEAKTKVGVDPLIKEYRELYDYPFPTQAMRAEDVFGTEVWEVVFCTNCLDHVENPMQALHKMWDLVKPGGHLVLTVEVDGHKNDPAHPWAWSRNEMMRTLDEVPDTESVDIWMAPWIGLQRYCQGHLTKVADELCAILEKQKK